MKSEDFVVVLDRTGYFRPMQDGYVPQPYFGESIVDPNPTNYIQACRAAKALNEAAEVHGS